MTISPDEYQSLAADTAPKSSLMITDRELMLTMLAMGLAGEAGELVDDVKKVVFHRHDIDIVRVRLELGDVLWYVAMLCSALHLSLSDVMEINIEKLRARYPDGFSAEASRNRT